MSWGSSGHGRRGDGTNSGAAATPVFVCGISTAVAVGGFTDGSAALLANGTLRTWGNADSGVLGNNDSSNHRCTPVAVCGISNAFSSVTWSKRRPNPMLVLSNGGDFNFAFIHRG
ncbi:MAG: hypothetical protein EOO38_04665 [Cytophagaceae bacterium]|nr:MAG: hypothetical protein EOO38_04665 [Cytophagaceae bacterium]